VGPNSPEQLLIAKAFKNLLERNMLPQIISRNGLIAASNESSSVTFLTNAANRIIYCNPAWDDFAIENGARGITHGGALGIDLFTVIAPELKGFYRSNLDVTRNSGEPWNLIYECSSPNHFRAYRMRVYPLRDRELLFTNSLVVGSAHSLQRDVKTDDYVSSYGIVTMCAHCRCSRDQRSGRWDYVLAFVRSTDTRISHGLCRTCREYFYPSESKHAVGA
jgi:hypothetical protein